MTYPGKSQKGCCNVTDCYLFTWNEIGAAGAAKEEKPGLLTLLVEDCLKNPYIWLFAISYFFVYVVRQGVTSWFIFYLKVGALEGTALCLDQGRKPSASTQCLGQGLPHGLNSE